MKVSWGSVASVFLLALLVVVCCFPAFAPATFETYWVRQLKDEPPHKKAKSVWVKLGEFFSEVLIGVAVAGPFAQARSALKENCNPASYQALSPDAERYEEADTKWNCLAKLLRDETLKVLLVQPMIATIICFVATLLPDIEILGLTVVNSGHIPLFVSIGTVVVIMVRTCIMEVTFIRRGSPEREDQDVTFFKLVREDFVSCGDSCLRPKIPPPFAASKGEPPDAALDWTALLTIFLIERRSASMRRRLHAAWKEFPAFQQVLGSIGLSGLMAFSLIFSIMGQLASAFVGSSSERLRARADLSGMGALVHRLPGCSVLGTRHALRRVLFMSSRFLTEASLQLVLQGSGAMAIGHIPPNLLLSMIMASGTIVLKTMDMVKLIMTDHGEYPLPLCMKVAVASIFALPMLSLVLWNTARLYYASFVCSSRMWGLTTGCVHFEG